MKKKLMFLLMVLTAALFFMSCEGSAGFEQPITSLNIRETKVIGLDAAEEKATVTSSNWVEIGLPLPGVIYESGKASISYGGKTAEINYAK